MPALDPSAFCQELRVQTEAFTIFWVHKLNTHVGALAKKHSNLEDSFNKQSKADREKLAAKDERLKTLEERLTELTLQVTALAATAELSKKPRLEFSQAGASRKAPVRTDGQLKLDKLTSDVDKLREGIESNDNALTALAEFRNVTQAWQKTQDHKILTFEHNFKKFPQVVLRDDGDGLQEFTDRAISEYVSGLRSDVADLKARNNVEPLETSYKQHANDIGELQERIKTMESQVQPAVLKDHLQQTDLKLNQFSTRLGEVELEDQRRDIVTATEPIQDAEEATMQGVDEALALLETHGFNILDDYSTAGHRNQSAPQNLPSLDRTRTDLDMNRPSKARRERSKETYAGFEDVSGTTDQSVPESTLSVGKQWAKKPRSSRREDNKKSKGREDTDGQPEPMRSSGIPRRKTNGSQHQYSDVLTVHTSPPNHQDKENEAAVEHHPSSGRSHIPTTATSHANELFRKSAGVQRARIPLPFELHADHAQPSSQGNGHNGLGSSAVGSLRQLDQLGSLDQQVMQMGPPPAPSRKRGQTRARDDTDTQASFVADLSQPAKKRPRTNRQGARPTTSHTRMKSSAGMSTAQAQRPGGRATGVSTQSSVVAQQSVVSYRVLRTKDERRPPTRYEPEPFRPKTPATVMRKKRTYAESGVGHDDQPLGIASSTRRQISDFAEMPSAGGSNGQHFDIYQDPVSQAPQSAYQATPQFSRTYGRQNIISRIR